MQRTIQCIGMKPKFLVDPQVVEFDRKIITSAEKLYSSTLDIVFSNPEKRSIDWRIDEKALDKSDNPIFNIHPTNGRVDPGQTTRVKASFYPRLPNSY